MFADEAGAAIAANAAPPPPSPAEIKKAEDVPPSPPPAEASRAAAAARAISDRSRGGGRPKNFVIKKGEYFKKPEGEESEDEEAPLEAIALPKSLVQEEEEKDLRKRFGKGEDEDVMDVYERHGAVKVTEMEASAEEEAPRTSNSMPFLVIIVFLLIVIAVLLFGKPLEPHLVKLGFPEGVLGG